MKLSSEFEGTPLKEYTTKINWREIMNYAAAIEDDNEVYFNDEGREEILAPPMFAVAVTWPILENITNNIGSDKFPVRVLNKVVHYTENLQIHRLIKPDDELKISGEVIEISPHRSGTYVVIQLNAVDNSGESVFTEYMGGLLRGVKYIGDRPRPKEKPINSRKKTQNGISWSKSIYIDKFRPFIYDGCTDIVFPIHTSKKFARFVGLPDIILQGTATLAYSVKEITNIEAKQDPTRIKEISCRFTGMVFPGTNIELKVTKVDTNEGTKMVFFEVFTENNQKAISNGYIVISD